LLAEGNIVKGTVVRLEEFGAFIDVPLAEGSDRIVTGLVHVSEVSSEYVENIYAYLTEGQEVEVKVLALKDDGKVDLSIKQADPDYEEEPPPIKRGRIDKDFDRRLRRFMHSSQMIQGEARRQREDRR
jgi:S1 RNA binding domain protein